MNFKYTALILASIVVIGTAQSPEATEYLKKFEDFGASVCAKLPTDDQLKAIETQCKCDAKDEPQEKQVGEMIKTCTKATQMTPQLKFSAFCGDSKACMIKAWTDAFGKMKPEQITPLTQGFDKYITCVKTILKL